MGWLAVVWPLDGFRWRLDDDDLDGPISAGDSIPWRYVALAGPGYVGAVAKGDVMEVLGGFVDEGFPVLLCGRHGENWPDCPERVGGRGRLLLPRHLVQPAHSSVRFSGLSHEVQRMTVICRRGMFMTGFGGIRAMVFTRQPSP